MPIWSSLKLWSECHLCKVLGPETQRKSLEWFGSFTHMFSGGFLQGLAEIILCIFTAVFTGYSLVPNRRGVGIVEGMGGRVVEKSTKTN